MAATSDEQMANLLTLADQISDDFENGINEIQTLKSNLNAEINDRQSLELTCSTLRRENERLKNLHLETLNNLMLQLQHRGNSHSLKDELQKLTRESIRKAEDHRAAMESLKRNHDERIRVLEAQIREISNQKRAEAEDHRVAMESLKRKHDEKIRVLEAQIREISDQKKDDEATIYQLHHELISLRNQLKDVEEKYRVEVEDLKDCNFAEQEEKKELSKKIRDLEKELFVSKTKIVHQQGSSSDKQLDVMKQKMMKLRRENEVLKRQLMTSKET